jgi:hypothetical protein
MDEHGDGATVGDQVDPPSRLYARPQRHWNDMPEDQHDQWIDAVLDALRAAYD